MALAVKTRTGSLANQGLATSPPVIAPSMTKKDGQFYIGPDGAIYRYHLEGGDRLVLAPKSVPHLEERFIARGSDGRKKLRRLELLIHMRDIVRVILDKQENTPDSLIKDPSDPPWAIDQFHLAEVYRNFVDEFGPINHQEVRQTGTQDNEGNVTSFIVQPNLKKFRKDPDALLLASIEIYDEETDTAKPGPIFTERVLAAREKETVVTTARDAYFHVLDQTAKLDIQAIAALLPHQKTAEIEQELVDQKLIIRDPATKGWERSEIYLSGDIRAKWEQARQAAIYDPSFLTNVAALEKIKPADIALADIDFTLGDPWLPPALIEDFAREALFIPNAKIYYLEKTNKWFVEGDTILKPSVDGLQETLNRQGSVPFLHEMFKIWVAENPARAAQIEKTYNDLFNSEVPPPFDGSHLTLSGMSLAITPRPHQLNAAWRSVVEGNSLYAHSVRTGKTIAIILGIEKQRRLGLINKPLYLVPNNLQRKFLRDYMGLLPNARILALEHDALESDGPKHTVAERFELFANRARTQPWDAVVMTHAQFDRIELSPQGKLQILIEDAREIQTLAVQPDYAEQRAIQSHLKKILNRKLKSIIDFINSESDGEALAEDFDMAMAIASDTDTPLWGDIIKKLRPPALSCFESLGCDHIGIDEAQRYKNLQIISDDPTLALKGSARASNLRFKLSFVEKIHPGRNVTMTTGTPVTNSLAEFHTMLRYLALPKLRKKKISHFDSFRRVFVKNTKGYEIADDGQSFRSVGRPTDFKNVPEWIRLFRSVTDIVETSELNLKMPRIKNGEPSLVITPPTPRQEMINQWLTERERRIDHSLVSKGEDSKLSIAADRRLAALDANMVWYRYVEAAKKGNHSGPIDSADAPGKVGAMVAKILAVYHENKDQVFFDINGYPESKRGILQLVTCDLGVPRGVMGDHSIYHTIRQQLIAGGMQADEIAFIHDGKNDRSKQRLFDRCNQGYLSVLIATTESVTGASIERRLKALHELDVPWRPSDVIQRGGRILSPSNLNDEVEIYRYVTQDSNDGKAWQDLTNKARSIGQIMKGDPTIRTYSEADEVTQEFQNMVAQISYSTDAEQVTAQPNRPQFFYRDPALPTFIAT